MSFMVCLRKEFLEQARTGRLVILVVVLLFFGMTSPLMAKYAPEIIKLVPGGEAYAGLVPTPTVLDAVGQFIKNINQFAVLLVLLLGMGMVNGERERGTAGLMLVKPIARPAFLLAKFVALALCLLGALLLAGLGAYYYTVILFVPPDLGAWLAMIALLWAQSLVYLALVILYSTLFRSQAAAIGAGLATLLLFSVLETFKFGKFLPGQLVGWTQGLFMPGISPAWPAFWVSLGIILASLAAAALVFERQEL